MVSLVRGGAACEPPLGPDGAWWHRVVWDRSWVPWFRIVIILVIWMIMGAPHAGAVC
jgi:hypothetical protein